MRGRDHDTPWNQQNGKQWEIIQSNKNSTFTAVHVTVHMSSHAAQGDYGGKNSSQCHTRTPKLKGPVLHPFSSFCFSS